MPNLPLHVPVKTRPTPEVQDVLIFEEVDQENQPYVPLPYGSEHPDTANYAGYKLCKEEVVSKDRTRRWWATEFVNPDVHNYGINFDHEDNDKPIYPRRYVVRRDKYNATSGPLTKAAAFTGVWMIKVTNPGTGYVAEVPPTVSFAGGAGAGVTARAVVNNTGNVTWIVITAEGSGYTSAPTVTITAPTSGTTALATAYIQAATALLTEEKMSEFPLDDPRQSIFVIVDRVYQTLPGATIFTYRASSGGNLIRESRQKVITGTLPDTTSSVVLSSRVDWLSTVVAERRTARWVDSSGSAITVPPFRLLIKTIEPEFIKEKTWITTVATNHELPQIGATTMTINGVVISLLAANNGGERRVPTFPSGQTGTGSTTSGQWEIVTAYVTHAELRESEDSANATLIVQTAPVPRTRYEFPEVTFQFPALLRYDSVASATMLTIVNGKLPLRIDNSFTYIGHRTRRVVAALIHRYSAGVPAVLSNQFKLTSPGAGSVFFGQLDANTIYGDVAAGATTVMIFNDAGLIEEFPFSSLSGCAPASNSVAGTDDAIATATLPIFYRLKAEAAAQWKGNIYERQYLVAAEDRGLIADAEAQRFTANNEGAATNTQYLNCA